jgi:hypothetical protein
MSQAVVTFPASCSLNILVSSAPKHLRITDTMVCDFLCDPVLGAEYLFKECLDEFQKVRLVISWWTPRVMDSSGFSSAKTKNMWIVGNLRCLLIGDHVGLAAYPVFGTGQQSYWKYYQEVAARSAIFRANVGRRRIIGLDGKSEVEAKATLKGPSCWTCDYKNSSQMMMPAVGFLQDARMMASLRINDLWCDEHTKSEATGSTGIDDQLVQRATRYCFNQEHPLWCNHQFFCATAEDTMHPSYERYKSFLDEARKGNPDYFVFSFSYKDYSDLPFGKTNKTFKQVFREEKVIRDIRKNKSLAGFRQEALGIWSKNGKGWYNRELIDRCYDNGREREIQPMVSRQDEWVKDKTKLKRIYYFLAGDPAKADTRKADDGSLVVLRLEPRTDLPSCDLVDWKMDYVWAYRVRRADASQWAAIIHRKHQQFDFSGIILDPGGGGQWVRPELAKPKQLIRDVETKVRPIACEEDEATMVTGDFCLVMFKRGDAKIARLWGDLNMRGDDNLVDAAHSEFHEALELGVIGFPRTYRQWGREVTSGWSEEKQWACRLLEMGARQLMKVSVRTNDDGSTYYSKNKAREFSAKGRKDFAYAMMYAFTRALLWIKTYGDEAGDTVPEGDQALCA